MAIISGIYDAAPIQQICKIMENISVWTVSKWYHFKVEMIEPFPPGQSNLVDMVAVTGGVSIAANGTLNKTVVTALQLNDFELLHLRFCPIDFVEGRLWEQAGQGKFMTSRTHARIDPFTHNFDPYFSTTTFWIVGSNRDMALEVFNPLAVAQPAARFQFWGLKYIIVEHTSLRGVSDPKVIQAAIGQTTWLPAEARIS